MDLIQHLLGVGGRQTEPYSAFLQGYGGERRYGHTNTMLQTVAGKVPVQIRHCLYVNSVKLT